jgi:DNA-binding IclR family transcriptional regulator
VSSIEKALVVFETLCRTERGVTLSELSRAAKQPPATVHRILGILKGRGYVRQDADTDRYLLTFKGLDLSLGAVRGADVRLQAAPLLRRCVQERPYRAFITIPGAGEGTTCPARNAS